MTSPAPDPAPLSRLLASAASASASHRAQHPQFKQQQLSQLHTTLTTQAAAICATLAHDTRGGSVAEVETEFFLTVSAVRHFYESVDVEAAAAARAEAHLVAKSVDNAQRRVPAGGGRVVVVVRPAKATAVQHTRLFSVVVPVAAAVAAGCCVVLELEENQFALDEGLREALPDALDGDTFAIVITAVSEQDLASCILVDQTDTPSPGAQVVSSSEARTIAVVDQSADIDAAAKAIVAARFSFQGMSPYAPDLVVVSESMKQDFFRACTRHATQAFTSNPPAPRSQDHPSRVAQKAIKDAEEKGQLSSVGSSSFTIVDISEGSCPVASMKIHGRYLVMMSSSNLTEALSSQNQGSTFLAGYFFGDAKTGQLLSQQLDCHISCINQLPVHLLVGPAAPISHPAAFQSRYSKDMFTVSRPQYIQLQPTSVILGLTLASGASKGLDGYTGVNVTGSSIRKLSMAPLPPPRQSSARDSFMGLFEQGMMSNVVPVLVVLTALGYAGWIYALTSAQAAEMKG